MADKFEWEKPENRLDFSVIGDEFEILLKGTINRVERQWPSRLETGEFYSMFFSFALKTAYWTYRASKYLVADKPKDPSRRPEFAASVPPLNRTIFDFVFNVVFIFDDYPARLCWYFDSGLRDVQAKIDLYTKTYQDNPVWREWLSRFAKSKDIFIKHRDSVCGGITPPKAWFPHPGGMLRKKLFRNANLYDFLTYLNEWAYGDLSGSSHGHWSGLVDRMGQVLRIEHGSEEDLKIADKYRSDVLLQQLTLLLCLTSEIVITADFDNKPKAAYLWQILSTLGDEPKDLYELRYRSLLT